MMNELIQQTVLRDANFRCAAEQAAAAIVVAAKYHQIACDAHLYWSPLPLEKLNRWQVKLDPSLAKLSPEISISQPIAGTIGASDVETFSGAPASATVFELLARCQTNDATVRRIAKEMASDFEGEVMIADGHSKDGDLPWFTDLQDWDFRSHLGWGGNTRTPDNHLNNVIVNEGCAVDLENLCTRVINILIENLHLGAWAYEQLIQRQWLSAKEIRDYLGWQEPVSKESK